MKYITVPNVELVTAGMNWPASTGPVTLTLEHLADAVKAAMEDPHVLFPRLKIGHTDERFNPEDEIPVYDPFHYPDGQPAFGKAANLRLENDGAVIVADYIEVPEWLAEAMPSAYPSRSIEGDFDVKTPGGKEYTFVLTAVALLGERWPAVQDLEDLERVLTEGEPVSSVSSSAERNGAVSGIDAKADVDKVLRVFWAEWAQDERYWHWPRSVWTDPNEIIVDDDDGGLYRLPFSSNDAQEITFGDPVPVLETFVDITSGEEVAASAAADRKGKPERVFATRKDLPPDRQVKAETRPDDEEVKVDLDKEIRERLGLAEDASDEEVLAAMPEAEAEVEAPAAEEEEKPAASAEEAEVEEPVAAAKGTVQVDAEELERLRAGSEAGLAAQAQAEETERNRILDEAIQAGKFSPARREHWETALKADPEGAKATIASLEPGLVPVTERGGAPSPELAAGDRGYPEEWLPEVQAREAKEQSGHRERVVQEA